MPRSRARSSASSTRTRPGATETSRSASSATVRPPGFDVLAVTDHTTREAREVHAGNYAAYLAEVGPRRSARAALRPARRARSGADLRRSRSHAVGPRGRNRSPAHIDVSAGLESALASARAQGAALVAAHPYSPESSRPRLAGPRHSPRGRSCTSSSTGSSSSTGTPCSAGSPRPGCPPSRAETSTASSISRAGRHLCRARRTRRRWSAIFARAGRPTSCGSTSPPSGSRPELGELGVGCEASLNSRNSPVTR